MSNVEGWSSSNDQRVHLNAFVIVRKGRRSQEIGRAINSCTREKSTTFSCVVVGDSLGGSSRRCEDGVVGKTRTENVVNYRRLLRIVLSIDISRRWGGRRRNSVHHRCLTAMLIEVPRRRRAGHQRRFFRLEKGQLHAALAATRGLEATIVPYALKRTSIVADGVR